MIISIGINKPGTAEVSAITKAQNCKRVDPLGFVKRQLVKGGPLGDFKKFGKKFLKMRFLNSVTVPKNVKRAL